MDDKIREALNDGHIATVGGLNKVYRFLLNKIGEAGSIYTIKGNKETFNDLLLTSSAENGHIYNIIGEDPEGYTGANYVCVKKYRIDSNKYQEHAYTPATETSPISGRTYYKKIDDEYVIVQSVKSTDNPKANGWYYKDWQVIKVGGVEVTTTNILDYSNGYYKVMWDALGGVTPKASIDRYGSVRLGYQTPSTNKNNLPIKTDGNDIYVEAATKTQGALADNSIQKPTGGAGSSELPVYITIDGDATAISTLSLGKSDSVVNIATFENSTSITESNKSTVIVKGPGVNTTVTTGTEAPAALLVYGGIVATSGISANKIYHAVWNDISDAVEVQDDLLVEAGYCYYFDGKEYHKTNKYCQKGIIGIHSDTAGSVLGRKGNHKELDISVGGFVLAYVDKQYESGTPLTCTEHGKLTEIKKFDIIRHPERIVGKYWKPEKEEYWGPEDKKVFVNNRHWIKVK